MAWSRGLPSGQTETIPLVHDGVMYLVAPGAMVQALDAATGDLLWEYKRKVPAGVAAIARTKNLAIFQDVILYTAPDSYVVGLDARTGEHALGDEDRRAWAHLRTDRSRRKSDLRRRLRGKPGELLHRGSRCA